MKLLLYVVGSFVALAAAALLITAGQAPASNPVMLIAFVGLFTIAPLGGFWMMYQCIRHEKRPFPLLFLAFLPFTFVWYYFERVRPGRVEMRDPL